MVDLYPPTEPYESGMLAVGDGNLVYWEVCGNPAGKPALVVHGGPGSGCGPGARRYFDPARYRIVLFDQRGCGRSTPHASDPATDMRPNTTWHLVADMQRLREHLGIRRWLLYGGSWGSTLILAYAERYPRHVSEIVIAGVTTTRRSEIDWLYRGVARFLPDQWERFVAGSGAVAHQADVACSGAVVHQADEDSAHLGRADADGAGPSGGELAARYARLMEHPDAKVRSRAAADWCAWEDAIVATETAGSTGPTPYGGRTPTARLALVRICTHFFSHGAWLDEGSLLRDAGRLADIPGILIHGRLDLAAPLQTAWQLHRAWPGSKLVVVADAGHLGTEATREHTRAALDRFAAR